MKKQKEQKLSKRSKNISQLRYNKNTNHYELDGRELNVGDYIEVLVWNGLTNKVEWIETKFEKYDEESNDWYLDGIWGLHIEGLFANPLFENPLFRNPYNT